MAGESTDEPSPSASGPGQRPVHRPRGWRLPHRGQSARVADGAVPVEGDRRADGRARGADRSRGDAGRARLVGRPPRPAAVRRGQGAGLLDGQAPRGRSVARAGDAVDGRGDRPGRRPARGARQGAAWRRPYPAAPGRLGRAGASLDRGPRQARAAAACPRPGARGLPVRGDRRDGRGPRNGRVREPARGQGRRAGRRRGRVDLRRSSHPARSGWSSTRRHPSPVRCGTRRRSATRPPPRGSCA